MDLHLRGLSDGEHDQIEVISTTLGRTKNDVVLAALRQSLGDQRSLVAAVEFDHPRGKSITVPGWVKDLAVERRKQARRTAAQMVANAKTVQQRADELYKRVHASPVRRRSDSQEV